ncbi:MAG: alpha/beta hydrolase [Bdellovibrionota bacterium]
MGLKGLKNVLSALSAFFITLAISAPAFSQALPTLEAQKILENPRQPIDVTRPEDLFLISQQFELMRSTLRLTISDERHLPLMRHHGVETEYVALLIHGLYGSPHHMKYIQEQFYSRGINTVSWLLPGHYQKNYTDLDKVTYQQWIQSSRNGLKWAQKLGKKVILVGFSTGSMIETIFASEPENKIAGIFMYAPALKIHAASFVAAHIGDMLNVIGNDFAFGQPNGKNISYYSPQAAIQLESMAKNFKSKFSNYKHLKMPIMVSAFNNDFTIDGGEVEKLVAQAPNVTSNLRIPLGARAPLWIFSTFELPKEFDLTPNKMLNHGIMPGLDWNSAWKNTKTGQVQSVGHAMENWLGAVARYSANF